MTIISALPFTLTNGATADASQVMANLDQIRDDVNANATPSVGGYRGAVVRRSAGVTWALAGANTALPFDTEVIDTDGIFTIGSPTRLTVPSGVSRVRLIGNYYVGGSVVNTATFVFYKNGAFLGLAGRASAHLDLGGGNTAAGNIASATLIVTPGDYFEFKAVAGAAADVAITSTDDANWFEMQILG